MEFAVNVPWNINGSTTQQAALATHCTITTRQRDWISEQTSVYKISIENVVLAGSSDFSCQVWTLSDYRLRSTLTGHSDRVVSAKFLDNKNRAVTASVDRTVKVWDVDYSRCHRTFMQNSTTLDVVYGGDQKTLVTGHFDQKLRVWDINSRKSTATIPLSGLITGLDITKDFKTVVASTRNNTVELVNLVENRVIQCLKADGFRVGLDIVRPCFSPNDDYVAVGSSDGGVYIWSVKNGTLETVLREHAGTVVCCHWSRNGLLVSCERMAKTVLWGHL